MKHIWGHRSISDNICVKNNQIKERSQASTVAATMLWQRSVAASTQLINRQVQGETPPRGGAAERTTPVAPLEASPQGKCLKKDLMSADAAPHRVLLLSGFQS